SGAENELKHERGRRGGRPDRDRDALTFRQGERFLADSSPRPLLLGRKLQFRRLSRSAEFFSRERQNLARNRPKAADPRSGLPTGCEPRIARMCRENRGSADIMYAPRLKVYCGRTEGAQKLLRFSGSRRSSLGTTLCERTSADLLS